MHAIKDIENAMIAAIAADATLSGYVKTVAGYQGDIDAVVEKQTRPLPGIFVMFGGYRGSPAAMDSSVDKAMQFTCLAAARDLRGESEARTKTGGAYDMLDDLDALLVGNDLDLDIIPFVPVRCQLLYLSNSASVWGITYETEIACEIS